MTDKLIAIVRFKSLPGVSPDERFEVRPSPDGNCGSAEAPLTCEFFDKKCGVINCHSPQFVYFLKKE